MTTRNLTILDALEPRSGIDFPLFFRGLMVPFVYTRLILVFAGYFAILYVPQARAIGWNLPTYSNALNMWSHFDGRWYLTIARDGYSFTPGQMSGVAFAPLYPMLMRLGGCLAGGSDDAYLIAGLIISNLSLIIALAYVMALLSDGRLRPRHRLPRLLVYPHLPHLLLLIRGLSHVPLHGSRRRGLLLRAKGAVEHRWPAVDSRRAVAPRRRPPRRRRGR